MRNFNSLLMVAAATVALSACAQAKQDTVGYLGSRDDIIVNNSSSITKEVATEAVKTEVSEVKSEAESSVAKKAVDAVKETVTTAKTKIISMDNEPMKTVPMKPVTTTRVSSETTTTSISPAAGTPTRPTGAQGDVPPNARPGECYAKVLIPAVTETKTERFQVSEEQRVLDRIIPAQYQTTTERVKVKEARTYWKSGHGPITKVNEVTGEILCLVEEPAEYKTIEKRVLVSPEKPVYKTVPAKFDTITKRNVITAESWEWRRILCETNLSTNAIQTIQRALASKGYNVVADGRLGNETMRAINSYQLKNGLASRGITYETLNHLGVSLSGA